MFASERISYGVMQMLMADIPVFVPVVSGVVGGVLGLFLGNLIPVLVARQILSLLLPKSVFDWWTGATRTANSRTEVKQEKRIVERDPGFASVRFWDAESSENPELIREGREWAREIAAKAFPELAGR